MLTHLIIRNIIMLGYVGKNSPVYTQAITVVSGDIRK